MREIAASSRTRDRRRRRKRDLEAEAAKEEVVEPQVAAPVVVPTQQANLLGDMNNQPAPVPAQMSPNTGGSMFDGFQMGGGMFDSLGGSNLPADTSGFSF